MKRVILTFCLSLICISAAIGQSISKTKYYNNTVTTNHKHSAGASFGYTAVTGLKDVMNDAGDTAKIFFTAYTKNGIKNKAYWAQRPIAFVFNGGPGSSSVWLHMGALGPKRILLNDDGSAPAAPYQIVDNEYTWLTETDLVFIDPVWTGYSEATTEKKNSDFLGFENDRNIVAEFIRQYLTENNRWSSPKYLAGESYGTTRATALAYHLHQRYGINLSGIALISSVMNFQTLRFNTGNDLPYPLILPSMAATAKFHGKAGAGKDLVTFVAECKQFAANEYLHYLHTGENKTAVLEKLSHFTGLSSEYLTQCHLRPSTGPFNKELLRSDQVTVGRLDSRFKGNDYDATAGSFDYDPSYDATILGPFAQAIYQHLGDNLKYKGEKPYEVLNGKVFQHWTYPQNRYLNTSVDLRKAMVNIPDLKIWISNGYYDLATPFYATEYTIDHMFLPDALKNNITMTYYEAGHMMYIDKASLKQFTADFKTWMK
jgi:carboxypeptidase C (cathepsin A)